MKEKENEGALHASLLLDGEDRILEGNRDAEIFLERPLEEVRKLSLQAANPVLYSALKELLAKTKRGRGIEDYAMAYKLGKRLLRLSVSISPYPLEALGSTGSLVNIATTLPRAVQVPHGSKASQLSMPAREASGEIQNFLEKLPDPAFLLDEEAAFVYVNPAMCALLGYEARDILGRPLTFYLAREKAKKTMECLMEAVYAAPWKGELEFNRADGTISVVAVTITRWGEGEDAGMLGLGRDFTAEARIKKEREEELRRVWSLLESVESALICFTPDHRVTLISASAEELLGITKDRAVGAILAELFPAEVRNEVRIVAEQAVAGDKVEGIVISLEMKRERKDLRLHARPAFAVRGKTREFVLLLQEVTREVTEAERLKNLLLSHESREKIMERAAGSTGWEEFLEGCLELVEDLLGCRAAAAYLLEEGTAWLGAARNLEEEDKAACRTLGLRSGYARLCQEKKSLTVGIHGGVPREGWDEVISTVERADSLIPIFRERRWRSLLILPLRSAGTLMGALALADSDEGKLATLGEVSLAALGEAIGDAIAALRGRLAPFGDAGGRRKQEYTDDENVEEEGNSTPRHMHRDEKETPSNGFFSRSGMYSAAGSGNEHDYFEIARQVKGGEDAPDHLTSRMGEASGRAVPSARGIDLVAMIRDLRDYYSRRGRGDEIFLELEDDLPRLHTDKKLLREALMCLLDNALKFSPPGCPVILGAERWGDEILLRVEDQGPGIPAEVIREVTQAGSVEKHGEAKERRAKSLLVCRKFVKAMGGELSFKAGPGEGTVAYIRIPVLPFMSEVS